MDRCKQKQVAREASETLCMVEIEAGLMMMIQNLVRIPCVNPALCSLCRRPSKVARTASSAHLGNSVVCASQNHTHSFIAELSASATSLSPQGILLAEELSWFVYISKCGHRRMSVDALLETTNFYIAFFTT